MSPRVVVAALVAAAVLFAPPQASAQGLALEVINPATTAMVQAPVTVGVPLPEFPFPLPSAAQFTVVDPQGQPVPCQFKPLSRWHGGRYDTQKSLKWVAVSFLADCPAASSVTYHLRTGWRPAGTITVQETSNAFTVSPAPGTSFVVDKNAFNVFNSATVDGEPVVLAPGGALEIIDPNGTQLTPQVTSTLLEEGGGMRIVLRQRGMVAGLRFTVRWFFHSGRKEVDVDFRLENPGAYGTFYGITPATQYFDSLYLRLPVAGNTTSVTSSEGTYDATSSDYELVQTFAMTHQTNQLANFSFDERMGGSSVASGQRYEGAIDVSGPTAGVTVAIDRFWQNYPKAFKVEGGDLLVGLWPEWGNGPEFKGQYGTPTSNEPVDPMALDNYRFEGGRWKTTRLRFDFHTGSRTSSEVARVAERVNRPAVARPPASWVKHTRALSHLLFSEKRNWTPTSMQRFEQQVDMIADDNVATPVSGEQVGFKAFRRRGGTYGGRPFYGWENYGDIIWGLGASSLHYDWPLHVLINFYRGGSYEFFDIGRDMVFHRRDYDQNHTLDETEPWRGACFYEKGWWHGNYRFGEPSHTWAHGTLLHFAMTGDEASYRAGMEMLDFLLRKTPRNWVGSYGSRIPGWTILNLVDSYNYLGVGSALTEARAGIDTWQVFEGQSGGMGYVLNPASETGPYPARAKPWQHSILFHGMARYVLASGDNEPLPLLWRIKEWIKNDCIVSGTGGETNLTMPTVHSGWAPNNYSDGPSVNHLWYSLDTMCHAYALFSEPSDLVMATTIYEVMTRFHQRGVGSVVNIHDAVTFSPISMRMAMFPNTESKVMANVLRWGQAYAAIRTWSNGTYLHY